MNLPRITSTLALLACTVLPSFQRAHAADAAPAAAGPVAEACKQDVQTLCPGVQPGQGRIAACLKGKRNKLSDGCKAAIKAQRKGKATD